MQSDTQKYVNKIEATQKDTENLNKYLAIVNVLSVPLIFFPGVAAGMLLALNTAEAFADLSDKHASLLAEAHATHLKSLKVRNFVDNSN